MCYCHVPGSITKEQFFLAQKLTWNVTLPWNLTLTWRVIWNLTLIQNLI